MGILDLPKRLLGQSVSKGSLFSMVSGFATATFMRKARNRWQQAKLQQQEEALLDQITAYDIGRGAGKMLAGWIQYALPKAKLDAIDARFQQLLTEMDLEDHSPDEKALSRFLVSKALFRLEGFKLTHCHYEVYQREAMTLLQKNPKHKAITRHQVFQGVPFAPEDVIATTHRMLLMLDNGRLASYLQTVHFKEVLRNDTDYMARLIALTLDTQATSLGTVMSQWFEAYCDFKINQTHKQEAWINTSITTATGGLPAAIGLDIASRVGQSIFSRKK